MSEFIFSFEKEAGFSHEREGIIYIFTGEAISRPRDLSLALRIGVRRDRLDDGSFGDWYFGAGVKSGIFHNHFELILGKEEKDNAGCPFQAAMNLTLDEGFTKALNNFLSRETDYLTSRQMAEDQAEGKKPALLARRRIEAAYRLNEIDSIHSIY